ncbi:hypothetical protein B0H17DRAFT_1008799 [Mycena rosella]|uniref:Uncharacterized protein n=1 Tax=Mycena rosella TaxID=1033263 RepID=A0AAD7DN60_MYCRO|nr:hypothetical protein B0H17DRAFT_1008799 [Mycena rosella]
MSADSSTIEFDTSPSAIAPAKADNRHFSIDLSLELERQLDMEDLPPTPHDPPTSQPHQQRPSIMQMPDIDPHVLAHIIGELRHQLTDMTRERDDLLAMLSTAHTKEAELEDALQHITEKAMGLDEALSDSRKKNADDAEAISMLRTKVEESRRGLMRLQAESRRQTPMTIDMNRANAPSAFMGPPSSKRASFTPLTGTFNAGRPNAHRRISSVSDSHVALSVPDPISVPPANRRLSGFFGRSSPPEQQPPYLSASPDELEKLRKELRTVQDALDETRHELTEANEAREASETCVGALREFIAENNVGGAAAEVKLPPLPATTNGEEADPNAQKKGWGFKLWKVDTAVKGAPGPASAASAGTATASPPVAPVALPNGTGAGTAPAAPLARKLTGFFSSRASISSVASGVPSLAPVQTTAARGARDSVYSVSDASSLAEPISPTSVGGGAGAEVRVRDVHGSPELAGEGVREAEAVKEVVAEPGAMRDADALSLHSVGI